MKKDEAFKWDNKDFVNFYTNSANAIMLERQRSIRIFLEIIAFHFPKLSGLNILDLGCGDGVITKHIHDKSPNNNFHLIDASEDMLNRAKEKLNNSNASFRHLTFEDYYELEVEKSKYDLVLSANAIHLDLINKKTLFAHIYKELKFGGLFLNIDPVQPSSDYSEEIQFELWQNWMNERLEKNGEEVGMFDDIPYVYKNNAENKPSTLWEQPQALSQCGFKDVDCFYKYSIFSVFGGRKER